MTGRQIVGVVLYFAVVVIAVRMAPFVRRVRGGPTAAAVSSVVTVAALMLAGVIP
jgi:hypothetical protein